MTKRTHLQFENWNKKAEYQLVEPQLGMCMLDDSDFLPLFAYPWVTTKTWHLLIWDYKKKSYWVDEFTNAETMNNENQLFTFYPFYWILILINHQHFPTDNLIFYVYLSCIVEIMIIFSHSSHWHLKWSFIPYLRK